MSRRKAYLKLILLFSIIIVVPIIMFFTCRDTLFNKAWLADLPQYISDNPLHAALSLIVLQILQVIICIIPGQPIQFAASYIFGPVIGYLISLLGAIIGVVIAFYLAKFLGSEAVEILFGKDKVDDYKRKISSGKGLLIVLMIYLIPGLPKDLLGYVAGISLIPILPFILVSSIGRTPPMFASLLVGHFYQTKNWLAIGILAVIVIIVLLLCWYYKAKLLEIMDRLEEKDKERQIKHGKAKD